MSLSLYNLTLENGGSISSSCYGSFSAPKAQELVVARGQNLEMLRVGPQGNMISVAMQNVFGLIRRIAAFRLSGTNRDYLVMTSDAGRIIVLEFDGVKNKWKKIHQETYGKTGIRRAVPGEYLATDPIGRTVMIGAIEKQKFVYILGRDGQSRLTISSPLEAHKSANMTFALVGLDVGWENPVFAAIELDHSELDEDATVDFAHKYLIYYELDLGLNHVVRKSPWPDKPLPSSASNLFAVPGGEDGPGGVLVCVDNSILYMNPNQDTIKEVLPRRQDMLPQDGLMITCGVLHKRRGSYFFLLQSEYGDLYKVTFVTSPEKDLVRSIVIQYFDTVPPATSLTIFRQGFLFVACEFSNHRLYQFLALGDDDEDVIVGGISITDGEGESDIHPLFNPRQLKNLNQLEEIESLSPITGLGVYNSLTTNEAKSIYAMCGRGSQSAVRTLEHGLTLSTQSHTLPTGKPERVWTLKKYFNNETDDYIVLSFPTTTLVLGVGASGITQVEDSCFNLKVSTILCQTMQDDSIIQIHQNGLRHIRDNRKVVRDWTAPPGGIRHAEANQKQVVLALAGGKIICFELDQQSQSLQQHGDEKQFDKEITCLALGPIPDGNLRTRFLSVGFADRRVMVLSLDPDDLFQVLARQSCTFELESLAIVGMQSEAADREELLCLYVGLRNGVLLRSTLDRSSGQLSDARTRFCGTRPCRVVKVKAGGKDSVLAISSRSWLAYFHQSKYQLSPLNLHNSTYAAPFSSEHCPEGFVVISGTSLKFAVLGRLGDTFSQTSSQLKATPRAFAKHPQYPYLIIAESEYRAHTDEEKKEIREKLKNMLEDPSTAADDSLPERDYGAIRAMEGKWASYIRVWDMVNKEYTDLIELDDNQAAMSLDTVTFTNGGGEVMLVVGTVKDFIPNPNCYTSGLLLTFRFKDEGKRLEILHKTVVDGIPKAICPFKGRVLVGVDNKLRIYDLGRVKLLRKCENKQVPNMIVRIKTEGNRIFVGDTTDSIHCLKYRRNENQLAVFADDTTQRWTGDIAVLDHNTIAIGDRLGNVNVLRVSEDISDDIDNDPNCPEGSSKWLWDRGFLGGAPQRLTLVCSFFVGSGITSLQKAVLTTGGAEVILYSTLSGSIGCLLPITSSSEQDVLKLLEMHLRQDLPPLCGRDHLAFRSYYTPQRCVIDGDFVEQFSSLPYGKQVHISQELNSDPNETSRKLEEIRNKIL